MEEDILKNMENVRHNDSGLDVEFLPTRVSTFDHLMDKRGIERGNTILISGGCGTGKSIFCMQSSYNAALNGEKVVYFTLEEEGHKIKRHMKNNFGLDIAAVEKEGNFVIQEVDPIKIAIDVRNVLLNQLPDLSVEKELEIIGKTKFELPFHPDRIVLDSLSALSAGFKDPESYRLYVKILIKNLNKYESVNFVVSETEQEPSRYSRSGIEEFLTDGVIILYTLREGLARERAIEIVKLRCSNHIMTPVPYKITDKGIEIYPKEDIFAGL